MTEKAPEKSNDWDQEFFQTQMRGLTVMVIWYSSVKYEDITVVTWINDLWADTHNNIVLINVVLRPCYHGNKAMAAHVTGNHFDSTCRSFSYAFAIINYGLVKHLSQCSIMQRRCTRTYMYTYLNSTATYTNKSPEKLKCHFNWQLRPSSWINTSLNSYLYFSLIF